MTIQWRFGTSCRQAKKVRERRFVVCVQTIYIRIAGRWCYAFRAIDEDGQVIDVYVSPTRDTAAATTFLTRAVESTEVTPALVTTD